jgi:hypothetical protein
MAQNLMPNESSRISLPKTLSEMLATGSDIFNNGKSIISDKINNNPELSGIVQSGSRAFNNGKSIISDKINNNPELSGIVQSGSRAFNNGKSIISDKIHNNPQLSNILISGKNAFNNGKSIISDKINNSPQLSELLETTTNAFNSGAQIISDKIRNSNLPNIASVSIDSNNLFDISQEFYFVQLDMDLVWKNNINDPSNNPLIFGKIGQAMNETHINNKKIPVIFDLELAKTVADKLCKVAPVQSSTNSSAMSYPVMGAVIFKLAFKPNSNPTVKNVGDITVDSYSTIVNSVDTDIVTYSATWSNYKNRALLNESGLNKIIIKSVELYVCEKPLPINNALALVASMSGSNDIRFSGSICKDFVQLYKNFKLT